MAPKTKQRPPKASPPNGATPEQVEAAKDSARLSMSESDSADFEETKLQAMMLASELGEEKGRTKDLEQQLKELQEELEQLKVGPRVEGLTAEEAELLWSWSCNLPTAGHTGDVVTAIRDKITHLVPEEKRDRIQAAANRSAAAQR